MNLVIGNTSQLSHYFPESYIKISSRNIEETIYKNTWNTVHICFAEQRTFNNKDSLFESVNYNYTKEVIEKINSKKIIYYSTAELWNACTGEITILDNYNYHLSDYIKSKEKISEFIKNNYSNVFIAYPFNFNSKYRLPPFLFGKVIDSIVNKKIIELGDTYYYRELLHPSFIVNETLNLSCHKIVGSGKLIFVNNFIKKMYKEFDMEYNDYVKENITDKSIYRKNIFYSDTQSNFNENELLKILVKEINEKLTDKIS